MFTPNYAVIPRRQSRAPWWWTSAASVPRCQGQKSGLPGPPRNKRYKVENLGPSPQIQSQLAPKRGVCVCVCVCVGVCACVRACVPTTWLRQGLPKHSSPHQRGSHGDGHPSVPPSSALLSGAGSQQALFPRFPCQFGSSGNLVGDERKQKAASGSSQEFGAYHPPQLSWRWGGCGPQQPGQSQTVSVFT